MFKYQFPPEKFVIYSRDNEDNMEKLKMWWKEFDYLTHHQT